MGKISILLDTITWEEAKEDGSTHYKKSESSAELVDLYRANGITSLGSWALTGAMRRSQRNLQKIGSRKVSVSIIDIQKMIHELTFLYIYLRDQGKESI